MPRRFSSTPWPAASRPLPSSARRLLYVAISVIALAGSAALPAVSASADTGPINFLSVSGNGSGNLTVTVSSDDPLANITVHLMSGATDVLDLTDLSEQGTLSSGVTQTWALKNPDTDLAALLPGTYTATADATDADNDQTVQAQPLTGTFGFQVVPSISVSQPTVTSTAPNQQVSIAGQLAAVQPLSTTPAGWGGQTVTITDSSNKTWTGTSASSGSFSIPVTGTPNDQYTASIAATPANLAATSPTSTLDVAQFAKTSITAATTSALYGQQSITGTLSYQSGLQQQPAAGGVTITASASGQQNVLTTTQANGSFSMMLPAITGTTAWELSSESNDLTSTPFLAGTQTSINATQLWPAAITGFSATLNKYYTLTVSGCLASTVTPAPQSPDYPTIEIQYAPTTTGPWHELGTVSTGHITGCTGAAFLADGGAPAASAYYRAFFSGDGTYEGATGHSVRAALTATRFDPFKASASSVASGKKITISGTLQYLGSKWHGYARQRVLLIYAKHKNAKSWFAYRWVTTNSKGAFSKTFADTLGTEYWSANYYGNSTHLVAGAPTVHVTVRGHAAVRSDAAATRHPVPMVGALSTLMAGQGSLVGLGWPVAMAADPLLVLMGR